MPPSRTRQAPDERREGVDALFGHGAQVRPVVTEVEDVRELLTGPMPASPSSTATPRWDGYHRNQRVPKVREVSTGRRRE